MPLCAALAAAILISLKFFWPLSILFGLALLFTLWFFRDPQRNAEAPEGAVLSPADGKIVEITTTDESEHIGGPAHKIAIFMSVFDVHVNRAPVQGEVAFVRHQCGKFLNALGAQASIQNECVLVAFKTDSNRSLLLKLIAGLIARRIVCGVQPGERLARGQRLGMIKFGSRAEVFLPRSDVFDITVRIGEHVSAGKTVLGVWR